MKDVKIYSVLCNPVQKRAIDSWQQISGLDVERHYSVPGFLRASAPCKNAVVFVGWNSRHRNRSARNVSLLKQQVSRNTYLVALSRSDDEQDIKHALEMGADRFIQTDVSSYVKAELINAITRRLSPCNKMHSYPPYVINQMTREVSVADKKVMLTPTEFRLIQYMFENNGSVLTRSTLLQYVWELPDLKHSRRVDTKLSHVKNKIKLDGTYGWTLTHPRGEGYKLHNNYQQESRGKAPESNNLLDNIPSGSIVQFQQ